MTVTYGKLWSQRSFLFFDAFRVLYISRIIPGHMFLSLQKPSSLQNRLHFFHGQHIPWIYLPSNMSGISLVGDLFVQLVWYIIRMNFGFKSKPTGMPFARITYRACMILCHDEYRLIAQRGGHKVRISDFFFCTTIRNIGYKFHQFLTIPSWCCNFHKHDCTWHLKQIFQQFFRNTHFRDLKLGYQIWISIFPMMNG